MMMDENEKLEKAGQKVTGGENNGGGQQYGKLEQPRGMGGTDLSGEDSAILVDSHESRASNTLADNDQNDNQPDLNNIKKNPDPEPGVPDQDF